MYNRRILKKALRSSWKSENDRGWMSDNRSSINSQLIYDIFGGEILKTHNKKGWHFYNRINGVRIDFTRSGTDKSSGAIQLEDIPSSPEETNNYFEKEDYSTFFIRFVREFEETVGLKKYTPYIY
jgi:hypothetical protein